MDKIPGAIIIEGHVQGLSNCRSLGEKGVPVWVVDTDSCLASKSKYCQRFLRCPDFVTDELADFLIETGKKEKLHGWVLIPSNDHAVITISNNRVRLEEVFKVITPSFEKTINIYNKENLLILAGKTGVPYPRSWFRIGELIDKKEIVEGFPVITRGKYGLSFYKSIRKKAFVSKNSEELMSTLSEITKKLDPETIFVQELIRHNGKNNTISFTAFCISGKIMSFWMGEKLRDHPHGFGTATCSKSVYIGELIEPSKKLIKVLDYTGVCEIEYLFDPHDNEYKLIEINARTWLWVGLAKACGVDFTGMIYDYVNGNIIQYPQDYRKGLHWIHIWTDLYFTLTGLIKGKYKLKEYLSSLFAPKVYAVFSWRDIYPFIYLSFSLIRYVRKR